MGLFDFCQIYLMQGGAPAQPEKTGQLQAMTAKQLKKMLKISKQQYPVLKQQYEKLVKQFQLLRNEKDYLKNTLETSQKQNADLTKQHQASRQQCDHLKQEGSTLKQEVEKMKKQNANIQKRLEQSYKKVEEAEGISEKVKQLTLIIDHTTKEAEQYKKSQEKLRQEFDKFKQLTRCEKELFHNTKMELEKLRESEKQTFTMKQELVRISMEYKNLKAEKEQLPIMIDKFEHQEHIIAELKEKIKQYEKNASDSKALNDKLEKKVSSLFEEKKELEKKYNKARVSLEEAGGQIEALKVDLQEERAQWQVQKRRYLAELKTLKVQLHNQHEKLKITQWELSQSKKREKPVIKLEKVNLMGMSKDDLFNVLEEMEMKNQSLKMNLDQVAQMMQEKDNKIKEKDASVVALVREITKGYPNLHESQGMEYVEKDIIEIGKSKHSDWGEIIEKVAIENLRLKNLITQLGEQFNQQLRAKSNSL